MIWTKAVILPVRPRKVTGDNQKLRAPLILFVCWHFVGNVVNTGLGSRDSGCQPTPHGQLGQFLPSCRSQKLRPDCVSLRKPFCFVHALVQTPLLCSRVLIPLTPVSLLSVWVFSITVLMPFYPLLLHRTLLITQFMHIPGCSSPVSLTLVHVLRCRFALVLLLAFQMSVNFWFLQFSLATCLSILS